MQKVADELFISQQNVLENVSFISIALNPEFEV
ncbi:hypothetical protein RSK20926_20680 [Roseobacter sp. SK209-2-6]|nr:hypothetical protein RSK20926_20680 [Roseobacter sp. SK209-2-6]